MVKLNRVIYGTLLFVVAAVGQAHAQSAGNSDAEIAALKQQLRLLEQKLDKLQQQTAANTDDPRRLTWTPELQMAADISGLLHQFSHVQWRTEPTNSPGP